MRRSAASATNANSNPIRATVDTSLFVSGLLWANTLPAQLVEGWLGRRFRLVTDTLRRTEVAEVLARPKFARYHPNTARITAVLDALAVAEQVIPLDSLPVHCRDPKDDKFLACALGGRVEYLVTGDEDLLALKGDAALESLRIVTVRAFLTVTGFAPIEA